MEVEENGSRPMVHPGPIDPSVLTLQAEHRSTNIWAGEEHNYIWCRRADAPLHRVEGRGPPPPLDDRIMGYIIEARFYGVYRLGFIRLDHALINALVERVLATGDPHFSLSGRRGDGHVARCRSLAWTPHRRRRSDRCG